MDGLVTMHQSDDNPFMCAWKDAGGVTNSWTSTALLMEGRTGLTAAMMSLQGYDVPAEIIFGGGLKPGDRGVVPHRHPARRFAVEPGPRRAPEPDVPGVVVPRVTRGAPASPTPAPLVISTHPTTATAQHHHRGPAPHDGDNGNRQRDRRPTSTRPSRSARRIRRCCCSNISQALRARPGQRRHHDRVPRRRDPRPARRERLGQVDAAEHRQRQPGPRQRHRRDRRRALYVRVAASGDAARSGHGVPAPRGGVRPDRRREPVPGRTRRSYGPATRRCTSGPPSKLARVRARRSARRRASRPSRPPNCSCSRSCRRCCRNPRCCCSTNRPRRSGTPTSSACTI